MEEPELTDHLGYEHGQSPPRAVRETLGERVDAENAGDGARAGGDRDAA